MTAPIRIQDSLSGELRDLEPREPGKVSIYACGPTVYSRIHVGNARPFVLFALLKRFLEHEGYDVMLVENITDINDKIYVAAREAGVGSDKLARQMTDAYRTDTDRLELGRRKVEHLGRRFLQTRGRRGPPDHESRPGSFGTARVELFLQFLRQPARPVPLALQVTVRALDQADHFTGGRHIPFLRRAPASESPCRIRGRPAHLEERSLA